MSWDVHSLKYDYIGEGSSTLIMLHGWGRARGDMRGLAKILGRYRRCLLIDLPGFGASAAPPEAWSTENYAEALFSFLDNENIKEFEICGHSFGGRIALRMASSQPERVKKLVLIGSHGIQLEQLPEKKLKTLFIRTIRNWCNFLDQQFNLNLYDDWFTPKFASRDFLAAGNMRATLVKTVNEDQSEQAPLIQAQTMLIYGELDDETPVGIGRRLRELIPNSKLIVLPGKGHYPFLDIGAHLCAYLVRPFLLGDEETQEEAA